MKKLYSLIALFTISATMVLNAQNRIVQIMKDGNVLQSYPVEQIDSIIIVEEFTPEFTPEAVDLGLSVKWASCNVGATSPEEYGGYYAWGETEEKDDYAWPIYKWCNGGDRSMTKYCADSSWGTVDNKTVLDPEDDVAHVKWGGSWRMPTSDEIKELLNKCSLQWTEVNGIKGQKVTGPNGNSIFLPAAGAWSGTVYDGHGSEGRYWSGTLYDGSKYAYYLSFGGAGNFLGRFSDRCTGLSVRPVTE